MNIHKKRIYKPKLKITAGGTDNVPPALCPPPAYASACVPAHVERTGEVVLNKLIGLGTASQVVENSPNLFLELTP